MWHKRGYQCHSRRFSCLRSLLAGMISANRHSSKSASNWASMLFCVSRGTTRTLWGFSGSRAGVAAAHVVSLYFASNNETGGRKICFSEKEMSELGASPTVCSCFRMSLDSFSFWLTAWNWILCRFLSCTNSLSFCGSRQPCPMPTLSKNSSQCFSCSLLIRPEESSPPSSRKCAACTNCPSGSAGGETGRLWNPSDLVSVCSPPPTCTPFKIR
mmetsp:Transcript_28300/g.55653  ORF Transcript_28300/g.55653 Transcript_28300/m.55653 type:complete len:214 (+) Transcript_28300:1035-1676(+)